MAILCNNVAGPAGPLGPFYLPPGQYDFLAVFTGTSNAHVLITDELGNSATLLTITQSDVLLPVSVPMGAITVNVGSFTSFSLTANRIGD